MKEAHMKEAHMKEAMMKEAMMNNTNTSHMNNINTSRSPLLQFMYTMAEQSRGRVQYDTGSNAGYNWIPDADAQHRKQAFLSKAVEQPGGGVNITTEEFCIYLGDFLEMDLDWSGVGSCNSVALELVCVGA